MINIQSDDYDILQDFQLLTLRQYIKNLKNNNENDNEFSATTFFADNSYSSSYDLFIETASSTSSNNLKEKIISKQEEKNIISSLLHLTFDL